MSSVRIGGVNTYRVRPWPDPGIEPAISWVKDGRSNWRGSDRGASQDKYTARMRFTDTEDNINSLAAAMEAGRESIVLDNFATPIFAPNVDHTVAITCSIDDFGVRKKVAQATSGVHSDVYDLDVTFRAIEPDLLATTPTLSGLRLQEQMEADHTWEVGRAYTQSGAPVYSDKGNDAGIWRPTLVQNLSTTRAILAYFLTTARATTFALPALSGIDYPFGVSRGSGPTFNVKLYSFSISRMNLNRWKIQCDFREVT